MPSSPGYVRNYAQEEKTAKTRGEQGTGHNAGSAVRHRARREAVKLGMIKADSTKDIDHKDPLVKGGAGTAKSNLRPRTQHANRSYPRTANAGMV